MIKEKFSKMIQLFSWNILTTILSFIIGFFTTRYISSQLGQQGITLLGSFRNFFNLIKTFSSLGIQSSSIKQFNQLDDEKQIQLFYSFLNIIFIYSIVIFFLCIPFLNSIQKFVFFNLIELKWIVFLLLLVPFYGINTYFLSILNAFSRFKIYFIAQIISMIGVFLATILGVYYLQQLGAILSIIIGEIITVMLILVYLKQNFPQYKYSFKINIANSVKKGLFKNANMALLSAIIIPITLVFIRNLIVENQNINQAGNWDALQRISTYYLFLTQTTLSMYYMPKLAKAKNGVIMSDLFKDYFRFFIPIVFLGLLFLYLTQNIWFNWLFTKEFDEVKSYSIYYFIGDLFKIMVLAFGMEMLINTKWKLYFFTEIIFNLLYILFSLYLFESINVNNVVLAYMFSSVIVFFVVLMFYLPYFKSNPSHAI